MKTIFVLLGLFISMNSFADYSKFICIERPAKKRGFEDSQGRWKLVLTQITPGRVREGKVYDYSMKIFLGENKQPHTDARVQVELEDVMFKFSTAKTSRTQIEGMIYLDEPTDSWMDMTFHKTIFFDCRSRSK